MLESFLSYIEDQKIFTRNDRLLVAVSGGMDSMALLALLDTGGFKVLAAHVNHKLRGEESDADSQLVSGYCHSRGIHLELLEADPSTWQKAGNFQQMARDLRYAWLQEMAVKNNCSLILTAHHADDAAETFILHAIRGSGLEGLKGIPPGRQNIVRPLIVFSRSEIERFVADHKIPFRHDASNFESKYRRNRIRNEVLPLLESVDPRTRKGLALTMENVAAGQDLLEWLVAEWAENNVINHGRSRSLALEKLPPPPVGQFLLYHLISRYGFGSGHVRDILSPHISTGAVMYSDTHRLLLDRDTLVIEPLSGLHADDATWITPPATVMLGHNSYRFSLEPWDINRTYDADCLYLDARGLEFPLEARLWKAGDAMRPLGMQGRSKKIQDILTNKKVSRFDKEHTYVLFSRGNIVAIVGHGIDESHKISPVTTEALIIKTLPVTD